MSENLTVKELIKGIEELLSLPDVVNRVNELIDSDSADAADIAEVISLDPALSAQLLKLVNSAFYSLPQKIDTISRAITLIGVNELRSLIFSASAVSVFNRIAPDTIDMDDFWFRSVYVGLAAKAISGDRRKAEILFLTGLLHDVGKIVFFRKAPETANSVIEQAQQSGRHLFEAEQEMLGFTSAEISGELLKAWSLGENLWKPIFHVHHPQKADEYAKDAYIVQLAIRLADCAEPELKKRNPDKLEAVQQESKLLESVGLNAEDLDEVIESVNMDCYDVLNIINPDATLVF